MAFQDGDFKSLEPKTKRYEKSDDLVPGLRMAVHPSGGKSWVLRFWFGQKKQALSLGRYPEVSLADARAAAKLARADVVQGRNPAREKIEARQKADSEAAAAFDKVFALYERKHINRKLKASTAAEAKRLFKATIKPALAKKKLPEITSEHINDLLDDLVDSGSPVAANRTLAALRHFFNFAVARNFVAVSPVNGIERPTKETPRDRRLTDQEIRWLWLACEAAKTRLLKKEKSLHSPTGAIPQLLLLTGARRNEVCAMTDGEVNKTASLWTIPGIRTKNGRAHEVHLTSTALGVLNAVPRVKNPAKFVFCTNGQTSISGFSRLKNTIDRLMLEVARKEDPDAVIPAWRVHDLRRTMASGMAALGVALPVIERCLNHVSGSFGGIVGVYQQHEYTAEKKAAFELWSDHIIAIVEQRRGKVLPLERRRAR